MFQAVIYATDYSNTNPDYGFQDRDTLTLSDTLILPRLKAHQFPPLRNLKKIDLSNNKIKTVHQLAFQNLAQSDVEEINLSNNQLSRMNEVAFISLGVLKHLQLHGNSWLCDCQLKSFRDFVVHRALATGATICTEPVRLADKPWDKVKSQEFACKPEVSVAHAKVHAERGQNATLECQILGNPVPAVKWVLNGRVIQNNSSPLQCLHCGQLYIVNSVATKEGGCFISKLFLLLFPPLSSIFPDTLSYLLPPLSTHISLFQEE